MKMLTLLYLLFGSLFTQDQPVEIDPPTKKLALVVGISDYEHLTPVSLSDTNAREMSQTLSHMNFEVRTLLNPDKQHLEFIIDSLACILDDCSTLVFYFSGHGLSCMGENYLLPSNAVIRTGQDARQRAWSVKDILARINRKENPGASILILDACCPNLSSRQERNLLDCRLYGLGAQRPSPRTMIAYYNSCSSVSGRNNSAYTATLLKHMQESNVPIEELFRRTAVDVNKHTPRQQTPFIISTMDRSYYLRDNAVDWSTVNIIPKR